MNAVMPAPPPQRPGSAPNAAPMLGLSFGEQVTAPPPPRSKYDVYRDVFERATLNPELFVEGTAKRAKELMELHAPPEVEDPFTLVGKINADLKAGRISRADAELELARAAPRGMSITSDGAGGFTYTEGVGVSGGVPGTMGVGQTFNPADVNTALGLITQIHDSPDLPRVTGPVGGGGGNDVEQLNVMQRAYYGSGGLATIEKIGQLQGQSWLAARDMLKGGGPITDYESRKAEQAGARLSRVKDEKDYQAALADLHDAIREGMIKLRDAGQLPEGVEIPAPLGDSDEPPPSRRDGRQSAPSGNTTSSGIQWSIEE
jgi:hypothetical protein